MSLQLIVSNPPKSTKRTKRGRKVRRRRSRIVVRKNPGGVSMAKRSRKRRRRSGGGGVRVVRRVRRVARRRRRAGGGGVRGLGGFVSTPLLVGGALGVAGYVGVNFAIQKVPTTWIDSDNKRIAVKAGIALAAAFVVRRFLRKPALATGIATGGLIAAGIDLAKKWEVPGVSGLGEFGISDVKSFDYTQLPGSNPPGMNGLGCFLPSAQAVYG